MNLKTMNINPDISVITVTWNSQDLIEEQVH